MLKELRDALKAEVALVAPIRAKIRATREWDRYNAWDEKRRGSGYRRTLHLALCYLRGTAYARVESKSCYSDERVPQPTRTYWQNNIAYCIAEVLTEYGCTPDNASLEAVQKDVCAWLNGGAVEVLRVEHTRVPKLYVVVRSDLPLGAQAVQAAHAMREFAAEHPEIEKEWHEKSNTLVMLSVRYETQLKHLLCITQQQGVAAAGFRESDMKNELTAICIGPDGFRLAEVRELPLALKEKAA